MAGIEEEAKKLPIWFQFRSKINQNEVRTDQERQLGSASGHTPARERIFERRGTEETPPGGPRKLVERVAYGSP